MEHPATSRRWTIIAAALTAGLAGCGPTLKKSKKFTPAMVRQAIFEDVCQLQDHFSGKDWKVQRETDINVDAGEKLTIGKLTFRLGLGEQTRAFLRLVSRLYERVPPLPEDKTLRVTVPYHKRPDRTSMPLGGKATIEFDDDDQVELPYHPCIGAFFFGEARYAMRRKLLLGEPAAVPTPTVELPGSAPASQPASMPAAADSAPTNGDITSPE